MYSYNLSSVFFYYTKLVVNYQPIEDTNFFLNNTQYDTILSIDFGTITGKKTYLK